jgi:DNA-binding transcriptional MerR regulator
VDRFDQPIAFCAIYVAGAILRDANLQGRTTSGPIVEGTVNRFSFALAFIPRYRVYAGGMRIGEVSEQSGVKVGTIRFYERRKLLKSPPRTSSGYRSYVHQDVQVVKGIKQLQELGFTLREIKELIDLHRCAASLSNHRADPRGLQRMIALTRQKLCVIENKSQLLRRMHRDVAKMLKNLQISAEKACPVARELAHASPGWKS